MAVLQKGFNYSQDGPGNRLVFHLQGCNLHCPWCSNPESMARADAFEDTEELLSLALRSRLMMFDGGGVTFTGGEPTVQFEALSDLLGKLKQQGIHTCMETNGTHPRLAELFEQIDFLIMDFKHYDSDKLKAFTGVGNANVLANVRAAAERRKQLLLRIPLINGFNASQEDAEGFVSCLQPLWHEGMQLEVLRYHEYGKDKWQKLGKEYRMNDAFVTEDQFDDFCSIIKSGSIELTRT
ncbi:MAG TPA: pyruvate formate lyase-activating protein [Ruminococcaceae bacterium]|nr:pyruvate formate lyase-activating protein [Oscillospiraceae bacterium]